MADVKLFRGGTPDVKFMYCEGDPVISGPPFGQIGFKHTPPYNAAVDGVYTHKDHTIGMPVIPFDFEWQRNNIKAANPQVGDFIQLILVPVNHYVDAVRFDVNAPDPGLAGATVAISAQKVEWDPATRAFVWAEITDVADAATAQSKDTPIALDVPSSTTIFLSETSTGYAVPLYVEPLIVVSGTAPNLNYVRHESGGIMLGLKILSLPAPSVTAHTSLEQAINDMYMSAKIHGFDCPAA